MTLIERFNKYAWVGVLKYLIRNGIFTTLSNGNSALLTSTELTNLADTLGLYTPARDIYLDYFFGSDALPSTLTISANSGLWLDMGVLNPDARQLVIQNGNVAPSYQYSVRMSRNGLTSDSYEVKAAGGIAEVGSEFEVLTLDPATYGYDQYVQIIITPDAGEAGDKLEYTAYLTGRGG